MRQALLFSALAGLATFSLSGCAEQQVVVGEPQVMVANTDDSPDRSLVGVADVTRDGKRVGLLQTWRFNANGQTIDRVTDLRGNALGHIDSLGRALRYTAHEGTLLVAHSEDRRKNVSAVFGFDGGTVEITPTAGR